MEEENYPNYKMSKGVNSLNKKDEPFRVKSVDGFAMLLNLSRLNKLDNIANPSTLFTLKYFSLFRK